MKHVRPRPPNTIQSTLLSITLTAILTLIFTTQAAAAAAAQTKDISKCMFDKHNNHNSDNSSFFSTRPKRRRCALQQNNVEDHDSNDKMRLCRKKKKKIDETTCVVLGSIRGGGFQSTKTTIGRLSHRTIINSNNNRHGIGTNPVTTVASSSSSSSSEKTSSTSSSSKNNPTTRSSNNSNNFSFIGKHKWLGGAVDNKGDGSIYGVPSHSKSVIRIQPPPPLSSSSSSSKQTQARISIIPLPKTYQNGKFKWLRGVIANGYLYGIPAWNTAGVLKMRIPPPSYDNNNNDDDINILPLPNSIQEQIQRYHHQNPNNNEDVNISRWMWHGAALSSDSTAIYCIPSNAQHVLKINVLTDDDNKITRIGPKFIGQNKWYGGILGADEAIYGIPYTSKGVLRIKTSNSDSDEDGDSDEDDGVEVLGDFGEGLYNWHGGVYVSTNQCIYAFPSHSDKVLKIDTSNHQITTATNNEDRLSLLDIHRSSNHHDDNNNDDTSITRYKWLGGCIGRDGCVYGMPSDANSILKIDPTTDFVTTFGGRGLISKEKNKWQGGVLSNVDGCIYAIPSNANSILKIDTNPKRAVEKQQQEGDDDDDESWRVSLVEGLSSTKDKWQGGFVGMDGVIYGIPENGDCVLKVIPGEEEEARVDFMYPDDDE